MLDNKHAAPFSPVPQAAKVLPRSFRDYLSWADISNSSLQVLVVQWLDAQHVRQRTVVSFYDNDVDITIAGEPLDEPARLHLILDVARKNRGAAPLHFDADIALGEAA